MRKYAIDLRNQKWLQNRNAIKNGCRNMTVEMSENNGLFNDKKE